MGLAVDGQDRHLTSGGEVLKAHSCGSAHVLGDQDDQRVGSARMREGEVQTPHPRQEAVVGEHGHVGAVRGRRRGGDSISAH